MSLRQAEQAASALFWRQRKIHVNESHGRWVLSRKKNVRMSGRQKAINLPEA